LTKVIDYYDEDKWGEQILTKPELYQREKKSIDIIRALKLKNASLLDIGCGIGFFLSKLHETTGRDLRLHGVDYSDYNLRKASKLPFDFKKCDLEEGIPHKDHSFDIVYAAEIIEHLYNPDRLVEEAHRVLKPGGYLLVTTPNLAAWYNRALLLCGIQPIFYETSTKSPRVGAGILSKIKKGNIPVGHVRIFTQRALKDILQEGGFDIVVCRGTHFAALPGAVRLIDNLFNLYPRLASGQIVLAIKRGK
jgi:ubiquinone/menaquinone biosynthesis C-methylase UbiE